MVATFSAAPMIQLLRFEPAGASPGRWSPVSHRRTAESTRHSPQQPSPTLHLPPSGLFVRSRCAAAETLVPRLTRALLPANSDGAAASTPSFLVPPDDAELVPLAQRRGREPRTVCI